MSYLQTTFKKIKTPLILTVAFVLSCFTPFIQVVLLTVDGGILSVTNKLLFNDNTTKLNANNWIVNFSLSIIFLALFCRTKSNARQVTLSMLSFIFLFCFIAFATMDTYGETDPYFLYFMVVTIIPGLILCGTAMLKERIKQV